MSVRWILGVCALMGVCLSAQPRNEGLEDWLIPSAVRTCLLSLAPLARSAIKINLEINPYYLRGDFDGDGRIDIALSLVGRDDDTAKSTGVCLAKRPPALLGALSLAAKFKDDPGDNVVSAGWAAIAFKDVVELLNKINPSRHKKSGIRKLLSEAQGEMIYMPYEDADGLIYYRRGRFWWYTINSTTLPQGEELQP